ncbi:response regulator transcription factor [Lachnospiraceae bacterium MD335]|nr:response regulator transcription factor [Lachnospiraceae bacterium MD335]
MKQLLIIVEDDKSLNQGLCKALADQNRQVISCQNIRAAREQLTLGGAALVLLDINLPDGNGLDFLQEIKAASPSLPVIMLTANDTDMDIVEGLEKGADDYITKPFSLSVLRARVNARLRQTTDSAAEQLHENGKFCFDFDHMHFTVNGNAVELSKTEQKLLRLFVENQGTTLSRSFLVDRIWTDGAEYVDENALSVTVKRLRDKLDAQEHIKTIYGIGYKFEWLVK